MLSSDFDVRKNSNSDVYIPKEIDQNEDDMGDYDLGKENSSHTIAKLFKLMDQNGKV